MPTVYTCINLLLPVLVARVSQTQINIMAGIMARSVEQVCKRQNFHFFVSIDSLGCF